MLGGLFKPKWQHKDAKVRIQALTELAGDSKELIQLAESDADTGVRLEAISRLTDIPTLIPLGQRTDNIGERARSRIIITACKHPGHDDKLTNVFDWLSDNPTLMKCLARDQERSGSLRKQAIATLDDDALLTTIAEQDSQLDIQVAAIQNIHNLTKLKQLEKTHGRANKRLRQQLKERITHEQARQDKHAELEKLCGELENLGANKQWEQDKTRLRVLQQSWQQNETHITPELEKRFRKAEKAFQVLLQAYEDEAAQWQPIRDALSALNSEADQLLTTLNDTPEQLTSTQIDETLAQLTSRWQEQKPLPDAIQSDYDKPWQAVLQRISKRRNALADDLRHLETLKNIAQRATALKNSDKALQAKQVLKLQSDWSNTPSPQSLRDPANELEQQFHQTINTLNHRLEKENSSRDERAKQMREHVQQLEQHIEAEQYGEAINLYQVLKPLQQDKHALAHKDQQFLQKRLQTLAPQLHEAQDWRRWGTDKAREHLIETAEHLQRDESIEPKERAKQIKALREEWRKLAKMEPGRQKQLWKEFDEKVTAAYEPSKQHFAEQAQQRQNNLQQREALCVQLEQMATDTDWANLPDSDAWKAVHNDIGQLRKQWKQCGSVSHKQWNSINQRFNDALKALDTKLDVERQRNWRHREQLVQAATDLLEHEDVQAATQEAKNLQSEWHITIPARPTDEQRLWKAFRAPIDELFNRLKETRNTQRSETDQRIQEKTALCEQAEQLAESALDTDHTADSDALTKEFKTLTQAFNALQDIPKTVQRKLDERFQTASQNIRNKQQQLQHQQQLSALDEMAANAATPTENDATDTPDADQLRQQQTGEKLCLQLEILLNLETPADFRQARMEYQVAQLSEAMSSRENNGDTFTQALQLLEQWYLLAAMPAEAHTAQQERITVIRNKLA